MNPIIMKTSSNKPSRWIEMDGIGYALDDESQSMKVMSPVGFRKVPYKDCNQQMLRDIRDRTVEEEAKNNSRE